MYQKVTSARERGQRQGLIRIEIPVHPDADPKSCTESRVIDVTSEIVVHLQRQNQQHFGQAQGTPFTINALASDFGFCGDTSASKAVLLHGNYQVDSQQNKSVYLLIQHLKLTHETSSLTTYLTVLIEDFKFKGMIDAWRESTTTSVRNALMPL